MGPWVGRSPREESACVRCCRGEGGTRSMKVAASGRRRRRPAGRGRRSSDCSSIASHRGTRGGMGVLLGGTEGGANLGRCAAQALPIPTLPSLRLRLLFCMCMWVPRWYGIPGRRPWQNGAARRGVGR
ncbi:putative vegetative cell wall protein gp1-like isoform X5 [Iris pallida]|uniref:Vegetative cell wall protein gp1-like isoform X5 n=1 Tax=Iris pallida TaxID=29817 RepID=A0AAX6H8Y6_IRIPA|nr:putative vegetative cell wall protein gp1-like isoform X5 [Iris pallida]